MKLCGLRNVNKKNVSKEFCTNIKMVMLSSSNLLAVKSMELFVERIGMMRNQLCEMFSID